MISINYRDARPIYEQVKDGFIRLILSGVLAEGARMPSVRDLASSLVINPNTIQRAYRELETEGYISSVPGKGSFVSAALDAQKARKAQLLAAFDKLCDDLFLLGISSDELIVRIGRGKPS